MKTTVKTKRSVSEAAKPATYESTLLRVKVGDVLYWNVVFMDPATQKYYETPPHETVVFSPHDPDHLMKIVVVHGRLGGQHPGLFSMKTDQFSNLQSGTTLVVKEIPG